MPAVIISSPKTTNPPKTHGHRRLLLDPLLGDVSFVRSLGCPLAGLFSWVKVCSFLYKHCWVVAHALPKINTAPAPTIITSMSKSSSIPMHEIAQEPVDSP